MPDESCHAALANIGRCFLDTTLEKIGAAIAMVGLTAPLWHQILNDYVTNLPTILQTLSCLWIVLQIIFGAHKFARERRRRLD
jgi:hypothetical protein